MAMISIITSTAVTLLRGAPFRYLSELVALERNNPPIPRRVFADAEDPHVIMLVEEYPHGVWSVMSGYDERFLAECLDWLGASLVGSTLGGLDERVLDHATIQRHSLQRGAVRCRRSFVCTSTKRIPPIVTAGSKLTPSDRDAVARYPSESYPHRPGFPQVFHWFVAEGQGEVFAIKNGEEILGYLSCSPEYENIWDVDFIHVQAERRGQGLGRQLAALYAQERLRQNQIPYYSGAASEASERTAVKAGFVCCREFFYSEVSRKC